MEVAKTILLSFTVCVGWTAAGCQWEVGPEPSAQPLTEGEQGACPDVTSMTGYPQCGESFSARVRPECNDCSDPGCGQVPQGPSDCVCDEEGELCLPQGPSADGGTWEICVYVGESCDCDDGRGRAYLCQCEGGGDDCGCWLETDTFFDPTVECE